MTELENYFRVRTMTYRRALAAADDGCSKGSIYKQYYSLLVT